MKITSRFAFKKGVFYWTSKSAISVEKGVFSRPESANMGCFLSLGTSIVYVLVGVGRGVVEWRALADSHHYIHTPGEMGSPWGQQQATWATLGMSVNFVVRRAGLLWSQRDFEWRWSVPLFKCLTVLEFSFILFDLCLLITFFNFIMNYVPIVTFWIFTYHKIWILSIMFCSIWSYWIIYFLACLEVSWRVVS